MGLRIIKTALAAVIAMYIAQYFGIHSPANTSLLAILGVETTKKKGIRSAVSRLTASVLALGIGSIIFWVFGFQPLAIGSFVLIVFTLLHRLGNREGIVTGTVVVCHLLGYQSAHPITIIDEMKMLIIGLGTATLINIAYMPRENRTLLAHKKKIEEQFSDIFSNLALQLRRKTPVRESIELLSSAKEEIERGTILAIKSWENSLIGTQDSYWRGYFYMRGEQLESIQKMMNLASQVWKTTPQGELLADVFEGLSHAIEKDAGIEVIEKALQELDWRYKDMPLPNSTIALTMVALRSGFRFPYAP